MGIQCSDCKISASSCHQVAAFTFMGHGASVRIFGRAFWGTQPFIVLSDFPGDLRGYLPCEHLAMQGRYFIGVTLS